MKAEGSQPSWDQPGTACSHSVGSPCVRAGSFSKMGRRKATGRRHTADSRSLLGCNCFWRPDDDEWGTVACTSQKRSSCSGGTPPGGRTVSLSAQVRTGERSGVKLYRRCCVNVSCGSACHHRMRLSACQLASWTQQLHCLHQNAKVAIFSTYMHACVSMPHTLHNVTNRAAQRPTGPCLRFVN